MNPITWFSDVEVTMSNKLLEIVYIIIGLVLIYAGVKNLKDKENTERVGTFVFWSSFGVVCAFGRFFPPVLTGILIIVMLIPALLKKVKMGNVDSPKKEYTEKQFDKIGLKIFAPALCMGIFSLIFALFTDISSLVGVSVGVILAIIMTMAFSSDNKPMVFLNDSERMLSIMGPLCLLPPLLGCLGSIFTQAGVGEVIAGIVQKIVPEGNVNVGIIVFALGMVIFTMIMGNAFAAITVITIGIGGPCVLAYGADPVVIGMIALTTGYCGTLMTPMAANFNIVPVAILDMKERFGVIKKQVFVALVMIVVQIAYMIMFK